MCMSKALFRCAYKLCIQICRLGCSFCVCSMCISLVCQLIIDLSFNLQDETLRVERLAIIIEMCQCVEGTQLVADSLQSRSRVVDSDIMKLRINRNLEGMGSQVFCGSGKPCIGADLTIIKAFCWKIFFYRKHVCDINNEKYMYNYKILKTTRSSSILQEE